MTLNRKTRAELFSELAERDRRIAERDRQIAELEVESIYVSARRLGAMIQDLVDSARLESGQLRLERVLLDVASFALDLKARLIGSVDTDRIQVETPEVALFAEVDPNRLERILTNLLSNALKYSEGQVLVKVGPGEGEVRVSVIDQGQGIPPVDLPRLFEKYYRRFQTSTSRTALGESG